MDEFFGRAQLVDLATTPFSRRSRRDFPTLLLATFAILPSVAGCSGAGEAKRRVESDAELRAQDERAFANSPDLQLPELRRQLQQAGVPQTAIRKIQEEGGVE